MTHPIFQAAAKEWTGRPNSSAYISPADTAKLLRVQLKANFPGTKFSVKTRTYSGGASIDVSWTDGPTAKMVEAVSSTFAGTGFDGMTDYKYSVGAWLKSDGTAETRSIEGHFGFDRAEYEPGGELACVPVHFGANFIFCDRKYSAAALRRAAMGYAAQNWDDTLAAAIRSDALVIEESPYGAWYKNADDFKSGAPLSEYGARTVLMNMAARRMLATTKVGA